jgi:hypothetical protein
MERQSVSSSNLASVGYDPSSETLEVEFVTTGKVYEYYNVPQFEFDRLLEASSIGQYFNANIRNSYSCSPV